MWGEVLAWAGVVVILAAGRIWSDIRALPRQDVRDILRSART